MCVIWCRLLVLIFKLRNIKMFKMAVLMCAMAASAVAMDGDDDALDANTGAMVVYAPPVAVRDFQLSDSLIEYLKNEEVDDCISSRTANELMREFKIGKEYNASLAGSPQYSYSDLISGSGSIMMSGGRHYGHTPFTRLRREEVRGERWLGLERLHRPGPTLMIGGATIDEEPGLLRRVLNGLHPTCNVKELFVEQPSLWELVAGYFEQIT